jgi:Peptidase propeptide and YPEB domain
MRINTLLVVGLISSSLVSCMSEKHERHLEAQAAVSKADAERVALRQVPGGTVKEGELEKEKGRLIWSFDIAQPGTSDIKEVQVDARTGEIASVTTETAGQEAKEGKKEKKHKDEDDEKEEKK